MLLTFGVARRPTPPGSRLAGVKPSPFRELLEAARAVWQVPTQFAAMVMAFVVNVTGYPFTLGLLPYVARDVYGTSQVGLGYLVASAASGCILASLILTGMRGAVQPARVVIVFSFVCHALIIVFGQVTGLAGGLLLLPVIGAAQMLCLLPMSVLLLRDAPPALR